MRRAAALRQAGGVSLFPFLAVLICTMGALIVLLVLVVKQAELQAHEEHATGTQQEADAVRRLRVELEDQEFLRQALENQRPQVTETMAEQRLRLSHLEDHIRQLSEKAKQLEQQLDDVERIDEVRRQDRGEMELELADLRDQIRSAQEKLEQARERAARQRRSYAIIPYDGPNGTRRRPIYVECTGDAVILQPEGVALQAGDFQEPLVPGNPLDAALLAVREFWARNGVISATDEPYPLLLVRSGGATAYAKARAAMKSWDDEFGYELIDAEMQLEFPPANPDLERVLRQAIHQARRRQAALAAAQPSRFRDRSRQAGRADEDGKVVLRASPYGGFTRQRLNSYGELAPDLGTSEESNPSSTQPSRSSPFQADSDSSEFEPAEDQNPLAQNGSQGRQEGPIGYSGFAPGQSQGDLAQSRGADWALPSKSAGATPYTRPIRIVCLADRLVIVPSTGSDQPPLVTMMGRSTRASISEFVASIWKHMETWGIAGRSAYWKPVLNVEVRPGGERRFAEMDALLNRSGLVVRRTN